VHGTLHLLEYDHAEPAEAATMQRREAELLGRFRQIEHPDLPLGPDAGPSS